MLPLLEAAVKNGVRTTVVTRPPEDFKEKDGAALRETLKTLDSSGVRVGYSGHVAQSIRSCRPPTKARERWTG
jgi:hypothetical protein